MFQIAKEDAVLPAALFPSLCELVFHNNPLVAHTRGMAATDLSPNPALSVSPRTLTLALEAKLGMEQAKEGRGVVCLERGAQ